MDERQQYPVLWPGWETVRLIGRGSYGAVYEIRRTLGNTWEYAAVKHIQIPPDEGEVERLRSIGGFGADARKEFTGLNDLDPDSSFIQALGSSRIKEGVVCHSIIGDRERADHAGGSDGIVPYSSSHLDGAASEVIVRSGHSVHRSPAAMRELLRILLLHLREE